MQPRFVPRPWWPTLFAALLTLAAALVPGTAAAFLGDTATHAPPASGVYGYNGFRPDQPGFPAPGQSFIDPVFGSTIHRLTNDYPRQSHSDIYAKNGYWTADASRLIHNTGNGLAVIDANTGAIVRASIPGNFDSSFAPDNADTWYYVNGATLYRYSIASGTSTAVKTFSAALGPLGGSVDWIDRTGRYMVLNIGGRARVWDRVSDVLYAGSIAAATDGGWVGLSPDGNWIVTADGFAHRSYAVNHTTRSVNTTGILFWTLCGDHSDLVSASNGRTYLVVFDCTDTAAIFAADVSLPQSDADHARQRSSNRLLIDTDWNDVAHFSGVSRGIWQDWIFVSIEAVDDTFNSSPTAWRPFKSEIVMANVLTGEVRRLAHHRSRSIGADYYYMPRVSAAWDGSRVAWASNFDYKATGYADIYSITLSQSTTPAPTPSPTPAPTPSPLAVSFTNPASGATVSGTVTVSMAGSGGSPAYLYRVSVDGATVYNGSNPTFTWNTTATPNGAHSLAATVTDTANRTATATRTVTVSNTVTPPPTPTGTLRVSITAPTSGGIVKGTNWAVLWVGLASGTSNTYTLSVGGKTVATTTTSSRGPVSMPWNTATVANGLQTLTATVRDATGNTGKSSVTVNVQNAGTTPTPTPTPAPLTLAFTTPAAGASVSGTATVALSPTGGSGGYTYTFAVDGGAAVAKTASFAWDTRAVANGTHTLTATVRDSGGRTSTATRTVTVANTTSTASFKVVITAPTGGATVGGTNWVVIWLEGAGTTSKTFTLTVAGRTVATVTTLSNGPVSIPWSTASVANGAQTLTATVRNAAGASGAASVSVRVAN